MVLQQVVEEDLSDPRVRQTMPFSSPDASSQPAGASNDLDTSAVIGAVCAFITAMEFFKRKFIRKPQ